MYLAKMVTRKLYPSFLILIHGGGQSLLAREYKKDSTLCVYVVVCMTVVVSIPLPLYSSFPLGTTAAQSCRRPPKKRGRHDHRSVVVAYHVLLLDLAERAGLVLPGLEPNNVPPASN